MSYQSLLSPKGIWNIGTQYQIYTIGGAIATGLGYFAVPLVVYNGVSYYATVPTPTLGSNPQSTPSQWQPITGGGSTFSVTTSSATPGTLTGVTGSVTSTALLQTSGALVGSLGSITCVGASGGAFYGVEGLVTSAGTLSSTSRTAGVLAQLNLNGATINGGSVAALWADWGATAATATSMTAARGIIFTNTTANVLNAQDYRYGNAANLLELAALGGTLNYYAAAGTSAGSAGDSAHCAAQQVIKILVNGVAAYIPVFTQNT